MTIGPIRIFSSSGPCCRSRRRFSRTLGFSYLAAAALSTLTTAFGAHCLHAQQSHIPEVIEGVLAPAPAQKKGKKGAPQPPGPVPTVTIPVEPLGFAPPAAFYIGNRVAQSSLNFLDEQTLLFSFRVPGLVSREHAADGPMLQEQPTVDERHNERHVRAVVLSLPSGKVTAETLWRLHDQAPYLTLLHGNQFLLRDRNAILLGDADLHMNVFLRFPGQVTSLQVDPGSHVLLANSLELPAPEAAGGSTDHSSQGSDSHVAAESGGTSSSKPDDSTTQEVKAEPVAQTLLRVFQLDTRKITLFTRTPGIVRVALDGEGYWEAARGNGNTWMVVYDDFHGGIFPVLPVESTCSPSLEVISPGYALASACDAGSGRRLTLMTRDKRRLWEVSIPPTQVWPLLTESANGVRFARATLEVSHPIGVNYALDNDDIHGQLVQVYDTASGKVALTVPATPVLDGGGNFALSPSGKRLAVLNAGALQIYDLPEAPLLPPLGASVAPRAGKPEKP